MKEKDWKIGDLTTEGVGLALALRLACRGKEGGIKGEKVYSSLSGAMLETLKRLQTLSMGREGKTASNDRFRIPTLWHFHLSQP